ncbi:MAG: hypothetical protein AAGA15_00965 [Pseudomonadota bacterium]
MITLETKTTQTGIRQRSVRRQCRLGRATEMVFVLATGAALVIGGSAAIADTLTWNGGGGAAGSPVGGAGTWTTGGTTNWDDGAAAVNWSDNDDAIFVAPSGYMVTVDNSGGDVIADTLTFNTDGVMIDGDALQINNGISFDGSVSTVTIDSATSGGFELTTAATGQTLDLDGAITGNFANNSAGTVRIDGTSTGDVSNGTGILTITSNVGGTLTQDGDGGITNVQTGGVVVGTTTVDAGRVRITGTGDLQGAATVNTGGILDQNKGTTSTVTINGGEFQFGGGSVTTVDLQSGELFLNGGDATTADLGSADVGDISLGSNQTLDFNSGIIDDITIAGGELQISNGTFTSIDLQSGEVNVNGATIGSEDFTLDGDDTLDLDSGTVGLVTLDGGRFEVSGGAFTSLTFNTGTLNVDGADLTTADLGSAAVGDVTLGTDQTLDLDSGSVDDVFVNEGTLDMDGGTIEGTLAVNGPNASVDGGNVVGTTGVNSGGTLALGGGSLDGAVTVTTGTLNLTGDGTIDDTLTVDGGGNVSITAGDTASDDEVTGTTTVNNGSVTVTQGDLAAVVVNDTTADANATDFTLTAGSIASLDHDAGETALNGGNVQGNIDVSGGEVSVDGATQTGGTTTVTGGTVDLDSGTLLGVTINGGAAVFEFGGGTPGTITLTEGTLNVNGGTTTQDFTLGTDQTLDLDSGSVGNVTVGDGTLDMDGGTIDGTLDVDGTDASIDGGNVTGTTDVNAGGSLALGGGSLDGAVTVTTGTLNLTGDGTIDDTLTVEGGGNVSINTTGDVDAGDEVTGTTTINNGSVTVTEGDLAAVVVNDGNDALATDLTLTSGSIGSLDNQAGQTALNGGTVDGNVTVSGGSVAVAGATQDNASTATISGGTVTVSSGSLNDVDITGGALGNELTVSTGGTVATVDVSNANGDALIDGGTVSGASTVSAGTITMNSGSMGNVTASGTGTFTQVGGAAGTLANNGGGTLDLTGSTAGATATGLSHNATAGTTTLNGVQIAGDANIAGGTLNIDEDGNGAAADVALEITGTTTVSGGGQVTLSDGQVGNVNAAGGGIFTQTTAAAASDDLTNSGGTINLSAGTADSLTNTTTAGTSNVTGGQVTGTTDINGGEVVVNAANDGTVELQGTTTIDGGGLLTITDGNVGDVVNDGTTDATANLTFTAGIINSLDNNSGEANLNGGTVNGTTNVDGGTVTLSSGSLLGGLTNGGTFNGTGGSITGNVGNTGTLSLAGTNVTGDVTNGGDVTFSAGTVTGAVTNNSTMTIDGTGTVSQLITNTGTLDVDDGTLNALAGVTNEGNLILGNTTGGTTGTLDGDVTNAGTGTLDILATGVLDGALTNAGDVDFDGGSITGTITNSGGFDFNSGTLSGVTFNNQSAGTANVASGATFAGNFNNADGATVDIDGTVGAVGTTFDNAGTVIIEGTSAIINGDFMQDATGVLDLQDGDDTTELTFGGDVDLDGTLLLDADFSFGSTAGDKITVAGDLSFGPLDIIITESSGAASESGEIVIFDVTSGNISGFSNISVALVDSSGDNLGFSGGVLGVSGGTIVVQTTLGAAGALAASVGLTQTAVGTVVNRPTSPYVVDLALDDPERPCGAGAWARFTGGEADISGSFTQTASGLSEESDLELEYAGFQVGGDFACFDERYGGFDLAFGAIGGYNIGESVTDNFDPDPVTGKPTGELLSVTETDFTQTYLGLYVTAARDRLFADLQLRFEQIDFESSNREIVAGRGLDFENEEYQNTGQTLSGSIGYSWPVEAVEGLSLVAAGGFSYTANSTDSFDAGAEGTIELDDGSQAVGFLSGTVARGQVLPDQVSLLSYFGTFTIYNDFADEREGTFTDSDTGNVTDFEIDNLGTYSEISAGLNYVRLLGPGTAGNARQLNAGARVDARFGDSIESWGVTAQIRIQF